jgi:hypothetical protein
MTSSLLNEIKIEIRSLLISSQNGLRENELCRDYSLFNCQRSLPYQIFGYSTVTDFLNSLTDILYRSSDNHIYPIVDQSTEHIFKFVQQQRTNKKKKQSKVSIGTFHMSFFFSIICSHQPFVINKNELVQRLLLLFNKCILQLVPSGLLETKNHYLD